MEYLEVNFKITPVSENTNESLTAFLAEFGYDSFMDTDTGLKAYVKADQYNETDLVELLSNDAFQKIKIKFTSSKIPDQNWNAVWEAGFKSVIINDKCIIRAPFHEKQNKYKYDIIIEPKMSFGTGHHETTSLMIEEILKLNLNGKEVLDMGSGTGVLAILASKKGAKKILAVDTDDWAFLNSVENIKRNNIENIDVVKGDVSVIKDNTFNLIIANINRNVLLNDIKHYANSLKSGGILLLSGIYLNDMKSIMIECMNNGFKFDTVKEKNDWVAARFIKLY